MKKIYNKDDIYVEVIFMKKTKGLLALFFCVLMLFSFTACTEKKDVVLSQVLDSINTEFSIDKNTMLLIEDTDTLELYYSIAPADVKQFSAETTLNSATDITEFVFVEAVDSAAAKRIYDALELRYNSQRDLCASYSAELLAIVNKCSVQQDGNFVALIMSNDFDSILEHYKSFF